MKQTILFSLITLSASAFSADRSIVCGDHWFKVTAEWTKGSTQAKVNFSGDSQPNRSEISATVNEAGKQIVVLFNDKIGGELRLENGDGTIKESKSGDAANIAPCHVN